LKTFQFGKSESLAILVGELLAFYLTKKFALTIRSFWIHPKKRRNFKKRIQIGENLILLGFPAPLFTILPEMHGYGHLPL